MQSRRRTSEKATDVAIVGGGVIALSLAWEFIRRTTDLRVTIVSPARDHDSSASRASGAMLSGYGETTRDAFASEAGRTKLRMRADAAGEWAKWNTALGEACGGRAIPLNRGTTVILNSVSGPLDQWNFDAMVEWLTEQREPFERIDPVRDLGLSPSIPDRPMNAIFLERESYVDSGLVLDALEQVLRSDDRVEWSNATCSAVEAVSGGARGYAIEVEGEVILATRVIVAAGSASLDLIAREKDVVSRVPPILVGAGTAIECHGAVGASFLPHAIRTPNRAFACGLHALPRGRSSVYLGATNNVQRHPTRAAVLSDVSFLIDCGMRQIDRRLAASSLTKLHVGNRPVVVDTYPLLGETSLPGLWIATGTYRDGFLMAPLLARKLFDAVAGNRSTLEGAEIFEPERRPLDPGDREAAIQHGIENFIAVAFERRASLPPVGPWQDDLRAQIEQRVRGVHAELGKAYTVPADFLWDIEHGELFSFLQSYYEQAEAVWGTR